MREIKVRVWDKAHHKFIGDFTLKELCMCEILISYGERNLEILQFTGLLDKNGKEIYEGDIVQHSTIGKMEIKFGIHKWNDPDGYEQEALGFYGRWEDNSGDCRLNNDKEFEVMGNIYETPQLLEEK